MRNSLRYLAALVLVGAVGQVNAAAIVTLDSVDQGTGLESAYWLWTYTATFDTTDGMDGAYFTFDNFDGVVTISSVPTGWSWNGSGFSFSGSRPGTTFSGFEIWSLYNNQAPTTYRWQDEDAYPTGTVQSGTGTVNVACAPIDGWCNTGGGGGNVGTVPEPGTLTLLGLAVAGLAATRRRKHRDGGNALTILRHVGISAGQVCQSVWAAVRDTGNDHSAVAMAHEGHVSPCLF